MSDRTHFILSLLYWYNLKTNQIRVKKYELDYHWIAKLISLLTLKCSTPSKVTQDRKHFICGVY